MALVLSGSDKSRIQDVAELILFFRNVQRIFDRRGPTLCTVKRNSLKGLFNVLGPLSDVLPSGHASPATPKYALAILPVCSRCGALNLPAGTQLGTK